MTSLTDAAIGYARRGWEIFPLNPDKSPATTHGFLDASSDISQVEEWWAKMPQALIGCRIPEGVLVLDIDPRHGGVETMKPLVEQHGRLPRGRQHRSGRGDGGGHRWFHRPAGKLTSKNLPGVDLLHHDLRYTILPPSPHPDTGKAYQWVGDGGPDVQPAKMPAWLEQLIVEPEPKPAPQLERLPGDRLRQQTYSESAIDRYKNQYRIEDLLAAHGWQQVGVNAWKHPSATSKQSATIRDGRLYNYSENSGLPVTEHGGPQGMDVFDLYVLLEHHGDRRAALSAITPAHVPGSGNGTVPSPAEQEEIRHETRDIVHGWLRQITDIRHLKPPAAIVDDVLYERTLAAIYGKPGSGKSFLAIDLAAHTATARRWHGKNVRAGSVLYIAGEGVGGIGKRIRAWESVHGEIPADRFRFLDHAPPLLKADYVEAMLWLVDQIQPDLIVVDTLARSIPGADENAAEAMTSAVAAADRIRDACDATLILVHHTPKAGGSLRGHSSLEGAVDTAIEVSDDGIVKVSCEKQKDAEPFEPLYFHKRQIETGEDETSVVLEYARPDSISVVASEDGKKEAGWLVICQAFGTLPTSRSVMKQALVDRLKVSKTTAYDFLTAWIKEGKLTVVDTKKSLLAVSGRHLTDL